MPMMSGENRGRGGNRRGERTKNDCRGVVIEGATLSAKQKTKRKGRAIYARSYMYLRVGRSQREDGKPSDRVGKPDLMEGSKIGGEWN